MLKFAFAAGICAEWLFGPAVASPLSLALAGGRAFIYMMVAWMLLEGLRALGKYVETFDEGR